MSTLAAQPDAPSDAELISRVRAGDQAAYGVLFERHSEAARRMARQLVHGPDVDDLVSEAFTKVLIQLQRGGGPDVAFRAYLLTAIRRLHVDRARINKRLHVTDDLDALDQDVEFDDPATASFERGAASRAFASLPERWQLVLWHLEVEGQKPADIAPLLGMSPNSVAALAYRAREGLRQAYLQSHLTDTADATCRWTTEHLGAYVRKGLAKRDSAKVESHLNGCHRCTAVYLELTEVNSNLSGLLAPALLGVAAPGYLAATGTKVGLLLLAPWAKLKEAGAAAQAGAAAAAVAAVVGVAAVAGGLGGSDQPETSAESAASQPAPDSATTVPDTNDSPPDDSTNTEQPPETDNEPPPPDNQTEEPPPDDETETPPDDGTDNTGPDTPTDVSGDISGDDVVLNWSPVSDATGYRVYRTASSTTQARAALSFGSRAVGVSYVQPASPRAGSLISGTIAATSYVDSTPVDGFHYTYSITAIGEDGEESAVSEPITVTYDPVPGAPTELRGQASESGVALRWQGNSEPDFVEYEILRDGEPLATSTGPEFTDASATDGSTYTYSVRAVDRAGQESELSEQVSVAYDPVPAAPTGVVAEVRGSEIVVNWAANGEPDLKTYEVFRNGTPIGRTTDPTFADGNIVDGQTYTYSVVAIDNGDQASAASAQASATYDPAPAAPTGVAAEVQGEKIALHWNAGSEPDLKTYEVFRNGTPIGRTADPTFADGNVTDGQTYTYSVVAIDNADHTSPRSAPTSATYDPAPAAPTGLTAKAEGHKVKVDWAANKEPDVGSYRVYRNGNPLATLKTPGYVDDTAPDGATTYSVIAIDKAGHESARSETNSADIAPDAPKGLTATAVERGISLNWERVNSDITEYIVLRGGEAIDRTSATSYVDRTAEEGRPHTYRVRAVDGNGSVSEASNDATAHWDGSPSAPTGLSWHLTGPVLHFSWNTNPEPDIDHYEVTLDGEAVDWVLGTHATDGGHWGRVTHTLRVVAIDRAGNRSPVAELRFTHDRQLRARLEAGTGDDAAGAPEHRGRRDGPETPGDDQLGGFGLR
ncbi:sigma-70 family RNA polymerase sigma factor [Solicola gregarius]|uniref:Sigma-70 family RNA polymerase sigma factor n=1 Tax=Solicola gregarius TaxID=2908642 RepID=A0AA46TJ32_9ACTN|nr:sigma-70 family RNA polymerase sigma factor [Solicola gregarius]UYM06035.1 sigma-70 family RNA polymerase sigma factor [Solicola gregarius]